MPKPRAPMDPDDRPAGDAGPMFAPFVAGSETSREAAREIEPDSGTLRERVLRAIRDCGADGATDEELQTALGMNPSTQRPRRVELVNLGLVVDSGRTRKTAQGRSAAVWVAVAGDPVPVDAKPAERDWRGLAVRAAGLLGETLSEANWHDGTYLLREKIRGLIREIEDTPEA